MAVYASWTAIRSTAEEKGNCVNVAYMHHLKDICEWTSINGHLIKYLGFYIKHLWFGSLLNTACYSRNFNEMAMYDATKFK